MSYGYVGDSTPDKNSLLGIGSFPHTSTPGSLVPQYSAALKTADAKDIYNVQPGGNFVNPADGKTYRYDDTIPDWSPAKPGYVDVYDPNHAPDTGVSRAEITRQSAIASQRPGSSLNQGVLAMDPKSVIAQTAPYQIPASLQPYVSASASLSNVPGAPNPFAPWMKTATGQDVRDYDKYLQGGGSLENIPVEDQMAVALAKDPKFLVRPENLAAYKEFVLKHQDENYNPIQTVVDTVSNLPGAAKNLADSVGKAGVNTLTSIADGADMVIKRATGWSPSGRSTSQIRDSQAQAGANALGGIGQLGADVQAMGNGSQILVDSALNAGLQALPIPQSEKDKYSDEVALAKQTAARDAMDAEGYATGLKNAAAQAFQATGLLGKTAASLAKANVDPATAEGYSMVAQSVVPEALGKGIVSLADNVIKPTFFEQGLYKTETAYVKGAVAADAKIQAIVDDANTRAGVSPVQPVGAPAQVGAPERFGAPTQVGAPAVVSRTTAQDAAQAAADHLATAQQVAKNMAAVGSPANIGAKLTQLAGQALSGIAKVPDLVETGPGWLASKLSGGNDFVKGVLTTIFKRSINLGEVGLGLHNPAAMVAAVAGPPTVKAALETAGELMTAAGKEGMQGLSTIPFWQRVAQKTSGMPRGIALRLDQPAVYALGASAQGAVAGGAVGGLAGAGSDPTDPLRGAINGAAFGSIFGMHGGLGQWAENRGNPATIQAEMLGNWNRFRGVLDSTQKPFFDKLSAKNQVATATFAQHFPGLRFNFFEDANGIGGKHTVNTDGTSSVWLNVAKNKQTLSPLLAHELGHQAAFNAILPDIYDHLLGNPSTGKIGQYTALGEDGKPVGLDPETGRYQTNNEWDNLRNEYINKMSGAKDELGRPVNLTSLSQTQLAKEIYAEHQADYLMSGQALVDTKRASDPYWTGRGAQIKVAMAKFGVGFSQDNNIVTGSGLFDGGIQRNGELDNLAKSFYQQKLRLSGGETPEQLLSHKFSDKEMRNPTVQATFLDSAPEFMRNADGSIIKDGGHPVFHTSGEVREINRNMANAYVNSVASLSDADKLATGYIKTGENTHFQRYLTDAQVEAITKQNANNRNQTNNLSMVNRNLADATKQGTEYSFFLHKATMNGRYGQFKGETRDLVPYGIEVTKDGNVNLKGVDFNQLTNNYLKHQNKPGIKGLWGGPNEFLQDAHTYFTNHAAGNPGETNLGVEKKTAIDALTGVSRKGENPFADSLGAKPMVKSFRLDRINRVSQLDTIRPFTDLSQYEKMATNFRPNTTGLKTGDSLGDDGHPEAIPATIGNPNAKDPVAKLDYRIVNSPLLGAKRDILDNITDKTKVPQSIPQDRMDSQFKFLGPTDKNKLQTLVANGAVKKFGDKVADYIIKSAKNPDVAAGMGWYSKMRDRIKQVFTDPARAERFTQLLGATSAQTPVDDNFIQAVDADEMAERGEFTNHVAQYQKALDIQSQGKGALLNHSLSNGYKVDVLNDDGDVVGQRAPKTDAEAMVAHLNANNAIPLKSNGEKFHTNSMQVLKVLHGSWLDDVQAPKTPNFAGNLSGRTMQATIDVWAARAMRRLGYEGRTGGAPWRILPNSEAGVSNLDFAFSQLAMEHAGKMTGMSPDDLQAVAWFAEKHHWDERGWTGTAGANKSSFEQGMDAFFPQGQSPSGLKKGSSILGVEKAQRLVDSTQGRLSAADKAVDPKEYKNARNSFKGAQKKLTVAKSTFDAIVALSK